jgi:RNA polymerase primary sigma factor
VDSEFGRTTDPVRMYMREMGSVELLTREGEIEIAKRIEDGLQAHDQAISACPTTIAEILELADKVEKDEMRIDEVVDGLIDPNAKEEPIEEESSRRGPPTIEDDEPKNEEEADDEDERRRHAAAPTPVAAAAQGPTRSSASRVIRRLYAKMTQGLEKQGLAGQGVRCEVREQISTELLNIRFTAQASSACATACAAWSRKSASHEREIINLCVNKGQMPRPALHQGLPRPRDRTCAGSKNEIAPDRTTARHADALRASGARAAAEAHRPAAEASASR